MSPDYLLGCALQAGVTALLFKRAARGQQAIVCGLWLVCYVLVRCP